MKSGYLSTQDGHHVYWETHGSPIGRPVVVLHGGPGGGLGRETLQFFDLRRWRVILFDQRGCGRSTPYASTRANTTWHLVADMERLREHLGLTEWALFGGSWGSTLALAYASRHAERVTGMVLRGVCLMEPWEQEWLYGPAGVARLAPEAWADFCAPVRKTTRGCSSANRVTRAYRRLLSRKTQRRAAARAWWGYEARLSHLRPKADRTPERKVVTLAVLENHYFSHNAWIRPGQLLHAAKHFTFPVHIVQGRYDLVCPPASAVSLAGAIPHSTLTLTEAGHAAFEPATAAALKEAVAKLITHK